MEFYDLPRSAQVGLIYYHTIFNKPENLENISPSAIYYDSINDMATCPRINKNTNIECYTVQKSIYTIMNCLYTEPLSEDLDIHNSWGFALEYNKKIEFIYKNPRPHENNQVAIIKVDGILKDKRISSKENDTTNDEMPLRKLLLLGYAAYAYYIFSRP